jgi:group I intron endonuclease
MGQLYKITFKTSGKSYIGISSVSAASRWKKHSAPGAKTPLGKAFKKYGKSDAVLTILAESDDWNELCTLETLAIFEHGTRAPEGYNLAIGGDGLTGHKHSPESRAKMSAAGLAQKERPYLRTRKPRPCQHCGKSFDAKPSDLAKGKAKYCSKVCCDAAKVSRVDRVCNACGALFKVTRGNAGRGEGVYCSNKCQGAATSKKTPATCLWCEKSFDVKLSEAARGRGKYCSNTCRTEAVRARRA